MTDNVKAGAIQIRTLHSHVVDAILHQHPETANDITTLLGGLHCAAFQAAVFETGFARIRSSIRDDRLVYVVELHGDDGWLVLCGAAAPDLGIPDTPEVRQREVTFHAERLLRELTEDEP